MLNFYEILGVKKSTDKEDIKTAYKKLAREYHPDKNPGNEVANNRFKEISEAYATLSDDEKRRRYDNRMTSSFEHKRYAEAFGESTTATNFHKPAKREIPKGSNLRVNVDLTIEDMHTGCNKIIKINKWNICGYCDGTGAKTHRKCSLCNGEGLVRKFNTISITGGKNVIVDTCIRCYGNKLEIESPCHNCQGTGIVKELENITVSIPKLASKDDPVVINGKGDAGKNGGGCGDLFIHINEIPHPRYVREYNDLYLTLDVNISDLVLGNVFNIETLHGFINMKIKEGTDVDKIFKIKGQGLDKNDLFIKLNLIIPKNLDEDEKKVYENLKNVEKKFTFTL